MRREHYARQQQGSERPDEVIVDLPSEEWRDVPRWEGFYQASSLGRIRSVRRVVEFKMRGRLTTQIFPSRLIAAAVNAEGYRVCVFARSGKNENIQFSVAVCAAFNGARPSGMVAAHNNGDRLDDRAENLRWATPRENSADMIRHGNVARGEASHAAKLTDEDVRYIKGSAASNAALARELGVGRHTITRIRTGRAWTHI
jgi:hypothetical protein